MSQDDILEFAKKESKQISQEIEEFIALKKEDFEGYFTKKLLGRRFCTLHGEYWKGKIIGVELDFIIEQDGEDVTAIPEVIVSWNAPREHARSSIGMNDIELD